MIIIKDLWANISGKEILKGFNLNVKPGEIHAIMGPNGAGKSTLARVLTGHPAYEVTSGEVLFKNQNLLEMEADERANSGLFMSFQYPIEIPGVSNLEFLKSAYNAKQKFNGNKELSQEDFEYLLDEKIQSLEIKAEFKTRNLNEGFSGGEKKRNEILQMAVLAPDLAILDETDSGLDIDAMRIVAKNVSNALKKDASLIMITHYQRLLDYIKPDFVHVMIDGKIVQTGGPELALQLEEKGYDWLEGFKKEEVY